MPLSWPAVRRRLSTRSPGRTNRVLANLFRPITLLILGGSLLLVAAGLIWWRHSSGPDAQVCGANLQRLVDEAPAGSVLKVPACTYRETVVVGKPLTLRGRPGAEIRGSDLWANWTRTGDVWVGDVLPPLISTVQECQGGTRRCLWREQVFLDGEPLVQVESGPRSGEFSVNEQRQVVLADDPSGRTVEVSTRDYWLRAGAANVVVEAMTMRHSTINAEDGAITNEGHDRFILKNNSFSDAHGALVRFNGGAGHELVGNRLERGGQKGLQLIETSQVLVASNVISNNNTENYDPGWEAGGVKAATGVSGVTVQDNEVAANQGSGIWFDIRSHDVRILDNRVHHNSHLGIFFEISSHATIAGNRVWENGYANPGWGQGAGILCHTCSYTVIRANLLAWNADGITVQVQERADAPGPAVEILIEDNVIVMEDGPRDRFALGWLQDYAGPLFLPQSRNRGHNNRFFYPAPEGCCDRFVWRHALPGILDFAGTPGGLGSNYITAERSAAILSAAGVPREPERH